jgi:hypothetical protein
VRLPVFAIRQMYRCITTESGCPYSGVVGSHLEDYIETSFLNSVKDNVMENKRDKRTKWLHIRLTEREQQKIRDKHKQSTSRKLSDYARKILLDKAIKIKQRNQSLDDFMAEMITLRNELNAIGNNYNQVVKKLHMMKDFSDIKSWLLLHESAQKMLVKKVDEIKSKISEIDDRWLQG